MEFSPYNPIVRICLQAMALEAQGQVQESAALFQKAWNESSDPLEKFMTSYFLSRQEENSSGKLRWLETALQFAAESDNPGVKAALGSLYSGIAGCYEELNEPAEAKKNYELAVSFKDQIVDKGPFFHGTKADLQPGDFLSAGKQSNYRDELVMNHIYFTALVNGAGLAAALAKGDGRERVYRVEPAGPFENDPNLTDKKFPGNLTRSYRSQSPLKITGEVYEWEKQSPANIGEWRQKLENNTGEIIN